MTQSELFCRLKELNFPKGEYVVVGGAMSAHGIRDAHDIDILVTPNLYRELYHKGWKQCLCDQCLETSRLILHKNDVDIVPTYMFRDYIGDTKGLIRDADFIEGFPFIKLEEFVKFKKQLGRPKDIKDIKLISDYLTHRQAKQV